MSLISQIHHIATATNDLDAMVSFYSEVFELEPHPGFPKETPVGRIAFYAINGVEMQIVEAPVEQAPTDTPAILLQHGLRLDHFTVAVDSQEAFDTIKARLIDRGASDGAMTPFGDASLLPYTDPDGHRMEVIFQPQS